MALPYVELVKDWREILLHHLPNTGGSVCDQNSDSNSTVQSKKSQQTLQGKHLHSPTAAYSCLENEEYEFISPLYGSIKNCK